MKQQTLQEFFDDPVVMSARYKLSASAIEPLSVEDLLALDPAASESYFQSGLDYPQRYGPSALQESVTAKYGNIKSDGIELVSGVDEALGLIFTSLVQPGDRVAVLTPCYPPHRQLAKWREAEFVEWRARPECQWVPNLDELRDLAAESSLSMLIATFPQNPTGFTPDEEFVNELIAILRAQNTILVSDEIYGGLPIGRATISNLADRYERAISLHGLSKTCGLPGLRVGWMATQSSELWSAIRVTKNLFNAYIPEPVAVLAGVALNHEDALLKRADRIRSDCVITAGQFFDQHSNLFSWNPPTAGVLSFPKWLGPNGTRELSDRLANEVSISLAPSSCFNAGDCHFRLGLTRRSLADGLAEFDSFLENSL